MMTYSSGNDSLGRHLWVDRDVHFNERVLVISAIWIRMCSSRAVGIGVRTPTWLLLYAPDRRLLSLKCDYGLSTLNAKKSK
jgi:hypothetical protein